MSSKNNVPNGPHVYGSAKFTDLVVGNECDSTVVIRVYGVLLSCSNIIAESFETEPGHAILSNKTLTGLDLPIGPSDAVNKAYVDGLVLGLKLKDPVEAATPSNINLFGVQTIDGYATNIGDRILVQNQTNGVENGIYIVNSGSWARSADLPIGDHASKTAVYVNNGIQYGGSTMVCFNEFPTDVVGTDALFFIVFISEIRPGLALSKIGNTLNVNTDNVGIEINGSNELQIKNGGITNANLQYDYIVISPGSGISGGGVTYLGTSSTISVDSTVIRTTGAQTMSGPKTFTDGIVLGSGGFGVSLYAPFISSSYSLVLPVNDGLPNQFLQTNGSGVLNWASSSSGDVFGPGSSTDNAIARFDGITGKIIQNSQVIVSDTGNMSGVGTLSATTFTTGTAYLSGSNLTGLSAPVLNSDAVNKKYVDDLIAGIKWKQPVRVATTSDILLEDLPIIDGIQLNVGDRILVKNQILGEYNGIYIVDNGPWTRASDMLDGSFAAGSVVWIEEGLTQSEIGYICTNDPGTDTVGLYTLTWMQFTGSGLILAGPGLIKTGNTLSVVVDNSTIEIVLNTLKVKSLGITGAQIATGAVSNVKLVNSSLTVASGSGLSGGGLVSLGSSTTLSVDNTVVRTSGIQTISGPKVFTDSIGLQDPDTPSNIVTLQSSNLMTSSYLMTLPPDPGLPNQILETDGTGVLSWTSSGSGDVSGPSSSTNNAIARFDGTTGKIIQNSQVIISDTDDVSGINQLNTNLLYIDSESISGQRLYQGYDSIGLISITNTFQKIPMNVSIINDSGYVNSLGEITFSSGGTYEVSYSAQFQTLNKTGGPFCTIGVRLEINSGFGYSTVPSSESSCFLYEENGNALSSGVSKNVLINITPLSILKVSFARTIGTATGQTRPGESSINIKRLRP